MRRSGPFRLPKLRVLSTWTPAVWVPLNGVGALVELALRSYGHIDVLFNLAATSSFNWLEDITRDEWDGARRGEVDLVFYLTRAAWPHLKARGGVVVNMASLNASLSFKILPSLAHTTNKAGIIGMTRQLALEGREHGIRANSIASTSIELESTTMR